MIEIKTNSALRTFVEGVWIDSGSSVILAVEADTLVGMDFSRQQLGHADLHGRGLRGANFSCCHLNATNFSGADLREADFQNASLLFVNFCGARLEGTNFNGALLQGAKLQGVDLRLANLAAAELRFARYDEQTLWPKEIDPQERGAKLPSQVREDWQV